MRSACVLLILMLAGCAAPDSAPGTAATADPRAASPVKVLHVPADPEPVADATAASLIQAAVAAGKLDATTALVYRGFALTEDDRLPAEYRGEARMEDAGFFREARDLAASSPEARAKLIPFLVRPTHERSIFLEDRSVATMSRHAGDDAPFTTMCPRQWANRSTSAPVLVWALCPSQHYWDAASLDIVDAELEATVAMVDDIFPRMRDLMGDPIADNSSQDPFAEWDALGGANAIDPDGRIDVYLVGDMAQGVIRGPKDEMGSRYWSIRDRQGVTVPTYPFEGRTSSGFILMHRESLSSEPEKFKSALAHELFHVFQNSFNEKYSFRGSPSGGLEEHWFVEASAVWAQAHFVKESSGTYVHPRFSDHQKAGRGLQELDYEAYIWPFFMEQRATAATMRAAWDGISLADTWEDADAAIDDALSFEKEFPTFALRNLNERYGGAVSPLYSAHDAQFPTDAATKPTIANVTLEPQTKSSLRVDVEPLRARYLRIDGDGQSSHIDIDARGVAGAGQLQIDALVSRQGEWTLERVATTKEVEVCGADEVILVVSNAGFAPGAVVAGDILFLQAPGGCDCKSFGEVGRWVLDLDIVYDEAFPAVIQDYGGGYQGTYAHSTKYHLETLKGKSDGNLTSTFSYSSVVALINSEGDTTYQRTQGEGTPDSAFLSFYPNYVKCMLTIQSGGMIAGSPLHGQPVNAVLSMRIVDIPLPLDAAEAGIHGVFELPGGAYCLDQSRSCDTLSSQPLFHWYQGWEGSLRQARATLTMTPVPPEGSVPVATA